MHESLSPRQRNGPPSYLRRPIFFVDLAGAFSKLAPAVVRVVATHRSIRRRLSKAAALRGRTPAQVTRPTNEVIGAAAAMYAKGVPLKQIAKRVGISHARLSRLLREYGVTLRRTTPPQGEVATMQTRDASGASLARIGAALGYSAGTVRTHLLKNGVPMRDSHGRRK